MPTIAIIAIVIIILASAIPRQPFAKITVFPLRLVSPFTAITTTQKTSYFAWRCVTEVQLIAFEGPSSKTSSLEYDGESATRFTKTRAKALDASASSQFARVANGADQRRPGAVLRDEWALMAASILTLEFWTDSDAKIPLSDRLFGLGDADFRGAVHIRL